MQPKPSQAAFGFVSTQADQAMTQGMTAQIGIVAAVGGVAILGAAGGNVVLSRAAPTATHDQLRCRGFTPEDFAVECTG